MSLERRFTKIWRNCHEIHDLREKRYNSTDHHQSAKGIKRVQFPDVGRAHRGTGDGGEIKEEVQLNEKTAEAFSNRGKKMVLAILNHRVPVICAVRGYALGGGMEMILAADITVAATDAKIGIPTIKLGGIPGWGSTVLLPRTVGASRAKELLYTGRSLSAKEALELGVIEYVAEPGELLKKAFELAGVISDMAPLAVENMKKSINTAMSAGLEESLTVETGIFASCFGTEDHLEATTAFLEKRGHGEFKRR